MELKFMKEALKEAKKAYEKKEIPVGTVIAVFEGRFGLTILINNCH